jgi:nucleoid DNA-binding protein
MKTITKKFLVQQIAQSKGMHPNDVRTVVQAFLDEMISVLSAGDRLEFRDFGIFEVVERKQKIGRNPKNAQVPIIIPPRKAVKFTSGKRMKQMVEGTISKPSNTGGVL